VSLVALRQTGEPPDRWNQAALGPTGLLVTDTDATTFWMGVPSA